MRRTFIANLILLIAVNLLVKPFYLLGIEAEIQNRTGQEAFGVYFALINFSFLLNIIPDMGITNWNTRFIAANPNKLGTHFPMLLSLRVLLSLAYLIIILTAGAFFGYTRAQMGILALLALNQVMATSILFLRSNLAALHLFRHDSLLSVLDRAILVVLMGAILWGSRSGRFEVEWLVWGQTFAYGLALLTGFVLVAHRASGFLLQWDTAFVRSALKESFPYALLFLVSALVFRIDSVMLERLHSPMEAGHYAMGFRFYEAVTMIAYLFAVLLLPLFSRMIEKKEEISSLLGNALRIMVAGAWVAATASAFWSETILRAVYDHPEPQAVRAFSILMTGCAMFSLQYVFGTLLTAANHLRSLIVIACVALGINALLNTLLIPSLGATGSAIANLSAQGFMLVMQVIVVHRKLGVSIAADYRRLGLFIFICCVALIACQWPIWHSAATISEKTLLGIYVLACLAAAFITRTLDIRAFADLLRRRIT